MDYQLLTVFLCLACEGVTVDGREIPREHIEQMAANYDPKVYGARINKEHYRAWLYDDEVPTLGDVVSVKAEENEEGKLCLLGQLAPNSDLVKLNERGQKVYLSIEYDVDAVQDKEGAYLMGLAVTDSPASTGTARLKFSIQHKDEMPGASESLSHYFSEFIESDLKLSNNEPSILSRVKKLFNKQKRDTDKDYADAVEAIELVAEQVNSNHQEIKNTVNQLGDVYISGETFTELQTQFSGLQTDLAALKEQLEKSPSTHYKKRLASEGDASNLTDC